ncbi:hypothetical protein MVEN_02383400 [Mycena venus]|uniref:Uncharacterized protein n=1 Tax=Mycena venus TaxID=2733690 RepID=A0A8H7CE47_9AGAR|nr:hypothetical protein MVEN_02383400 [Mycena venus]
MPNKDTSSAIAPLRSTREYLAWAIDVESELRKEGLWTVVSAGSPPVATTASVSSGGSVSVSIPLRDTFEERDSRALGLIRTHLARRLVTKYASYSSSKGLWDALKKDFSTDNKVELAFHTLNALHSIKLHLPADTTNVKFSAMEKHVETVANLINELDNLGFGLDADLQPLYLLRSLPRSGRFDTLQASILGSVPSGTKLTLDDVEKKLLAQTEPDTGDSASDTETDTAAVARPSAAKAPNITLPNCYCHFHKSTTHNTDDCLVLKEAAKQGKGKGKGKGKAKAEKANSAKDSDTDDDLWSHLLLLPYAELLAGACHLHGLHLGLVLHLQLQLQLLELVAPHVLGNLPYTQMRHMFRQLLNLSTRQKQMLIPKIPSIPLNNQIQHLHLNG